MRQCLLLLFESMWSPAWEASPACNIPKAYQKLVCVSGERLVAGADFG